MRFVACLSRSDIRVGIAENFFKLVDEEADILRRIFLDHACQFGESVLTAAQHRVGDSDVNRPFFRLQTPVADHVVDSSFGNVEDRYRARSDRHHMPFRSGACYKSTVQNGKKSGEHEGGLTASGITEYSQEATARELEEDLFNLPFTSEEEMALNGGIRTQSRERISRRRI